MIRPTPSIQSIRDRTATRRSPRGRSARGLTLVELLLALTVTATVALAITTMLFAVAGGTTSEGNIRAAVVNHKTLITRLTAAIRGSRQVLYLDDRYLLLWISDTRENDQPNRSELRLIERHPELQAVAAYTCEFPEGWSEQQRAGADTAYDIGSNWAAIVPTLPGGELFTVEVWGEQVTALAWTTDTPEAQAGRLVSLRLSSGLSDQADTAVGAAALRN